MISIRRNIFETNSSATHTLVYKTHNGDLAIKIKGYMCELFKEDGSTAEEGEPGYVKVHFGHFGGEQKVIRGLHDKLNYIATLIMSETENRIDNEAYEYGSDVNGTFYWNTPEKDNISPNNWRDWLTDKERLENNPEWLEIVDVLRKNIPGCLGVILEPSSGHSEDFSVYKDFIDGKGVTIEQLLFCDDIMIMLEHT